ncbi:MAG: hypothetical protein HC915_06645 [Anaerolineae bacterium]|nr:hypothetical protein [Anaerolineae bacterium]
MTETISILWTMDDEAIRYQRCAICGQQRQRVVRQSGRPDFALCGNCRSAFVLEDGGKMRMLYGRITELMPHTREFALSKWQTYFEVSARAAQERQDNIEDHLPAELRDDPTNAIHGNFDTNMSAYLALEAERSELLYERARKVAPPPRRLKETGELPNLDDLFKDLERKDDKKDD